MQASWKKIAKLSACAAGLMTAGAAYAQSSVTLYGMVDGGVIYTNKTLNLATGKNEGAQLGAHDAGSVPSYFGMTGSEDLGDGLKANFRLESGIDVMNGGYNNSNGNLFGRQAYVQLAGGFGELTAGLQFSPFFYSVFETDPRGLSEFGSGLITYVDNFLVSGIFDANAFSYRTPDIDGFQAHVMFAPGGVAGNFQAGRQESASLKYEHAGFLINAAVFSGKPGGDAALGNGDNLLGKTLGVSYKYGALTAKAAYVGYKDSTAGINTNVYSGGLDYRASPAVDLNAGVYYTTDRTQHANHSLMGALGTTYQLSKRTAVYAQVGAVSNHGTMDTGLDISNALWEVPGKTTIGGDIGVRHAF